MNEQFNWYKKPTGTQRYTTLTCVQMSDIFLKFTTNRLYYKNTQLICIPQKGGDHLVLCHQYSNILCLQEPAHVLKMSLICHSEC